MRLHRSALMMFAVTASACASPGLSATERQQIAADIEQQVKSAYDLRKPDPARSFEELYADSGRLVSASAGSIISSRDTLFTGIRAFWEFVGSNMRDPQWMWDQVMIDVLSRDAAVMTATYHVPHTTPAGRPHVIGGAWTAVFRREGDRWVIVQEHLSDTPPGVADSAHANMDHGTRPPG